MAGLGRRSHYRKHLTDSVLYDFPEPRAPSEQIGRIVGSRGGNCFDVLLASSDSRRSSSVSSNVSSSGSTTELAILPTKFRKLVWVKRGDYVIVECGTNKETENENTNQQDSLKPKPKKTNTKKTEYSKKVKNTDSSTSRMDGGGGFRFMIQHVLYKEQVKHLKDKGLWPSLFLETNDEDDVEVSADDDQDAHCQPPLQSQQQSQQQQPLQPQPSEDPEEPNNNSNDNDNDNNDKDMDNNGITPMNDYFNDNDNLWLVGNTNRMAQLSVQDDYDDNSTCDEYE